MMYNESFKYCMYVVFFSISFQFVACRANASRSDGGAAPHRYVYLGEPQADLNVRGAQRGARCDTIKFGR